MGEWRNEMFAELSWPIMVMLILHHADRDGVPDQADTAGRHLVEDGAGIDALHIIVGRLLFVASEMFNVISYWTGQSGKRISKLSRHCYRAKLFPEWFAPLVV